MVLGLLLVFAVLLAWIDWVDSPNRTETAHMVAGLYAWHTYRFDVFHANPPLVRAVATAPIVLCCPKCDWESYSCRPHERCEWALGSAFICTNDAKNVRWFFTLARWMCIPFALCGGYICHRLARELYGEASGLCALALWCFSPTLLGWGATICPDVPAAALGLAAMYALRQWLREPRWDRVLLAGVILGLAELTKFTLLVFYPLLPAFWLLCRLPERRQIRKRQWFSEVVHISVIVALSVLVINVGYGFEGSFQRLGNYQFRTTMLTGYDSLDDIPSEGANRFAGTWVGMLPVPLPANMVQGIDTQRYDFERGLPSYLRGKWADHGWWHYYLYALLIKVPLGTWALVVMAIGATIFARGYSASWRDEMIVLAPFVVLLVFVSSQTGFSVHSRYVIPAMPFLFIWTSKVARVFEMRPFTQKRMAMAAMVILALAWSVGSSLAVYPHSLSYFSELAAVLPTPADSSYPKPFSTSDENHSVLSTIKSALSAGPRNGPHHLLDSNIDWGQDLFYLEDWYESHPEARPIQVAYLGGYPLGQSKIKSAGSPPIGLDREQINDKTTPVGPLPGWYALSVNAIYSRSQQYRYFLHFQPVATAGYSIYIYHITLDEANQVRKELGLLEVPKDWLPSEKIAFAE